MKIVKHSPAVSSVRDKQRRPELFETKNGEWFARIETKGQFSFFHWPALKRVEYPVIPKLKEAISEFELLSEYGPGAQDWLEDNQNEGK